MSRIGKKPVAVPKGVDAKVEGKTLLIKGPKGSMTFNIAPEIKVDVVENEILVSNLGTTKESRAIHGLNRCMIANIITGVTQGYLIKLKITGVGYRADLQGKKLTVSAGYSHQVDVIAPDGIKIEVENPQTVTVSGIDKVMVGQIAAKIRKIKPAEPYNGKGIQYIDEKVRRKAGKSGK